MRKAHINIIAFHRTAKAYTVGSMRNLSRSYPLRHTATPQAFQKPQETPTEVSKGDIVTFTGGGVYKSSTAEYASVQRNVTSTCKVTAVNTKGTHPYHCISQDGKGVYGWVNAADVK